MTNEELIAEINNGNPAAVLVLWENVKRFAASQAKKYIARNGIQSKTCEAEDLIQEAFLALPEAIEKYKPGESSFLFFFSYILKNTFRNYCGLNTSQGRKELYSDLSLSELLNPEDESGISYEDNLEDKRAAAAFDYAEKKIFIEELSKELNKYLEKTLSEREREIIVSRFFLLKTQKDLAEEKSLSPARIQQIEEKAMKKMKRSIFTSKGKELQQFVDSNTQYRHYGIQHTIRTGNSEVEEIVFQRERLERDFINGKFE